MTTKECLNLIKWLKRKGYALEEITEILEYIAETKPLNNDD